MKIARFAWSNYRNLEDGEIVADGRDVVISGRNGVGKSSIASILPFVLFGRITSKSFDERGLTVNNQVPTATVAFDDGQTFSRSVTSDNKYRTFFDGKEISATRFNAQVDRLTNGGGAMLFNPFEFPNMNWKTQRDFLLSTLTDIKGLPSVENLRDNLKTARRQLDELQARMSEIDSQLATMPTGDAAALDEEIAALELDLAKFTAENQLSGGKIELVRREISNLKTSISAKENRTRDLIDERDIMRDQYLNVPKNCPTCGAPLNPERIKKARDSIAEVGLKTSAKIKENQEALAKLREQLSQAKRELEGLSEQSEKPVDTGAVTAELRDLRDRRAKISQRQELISRRETYENRQAKLFSHIRELELQIENVDAQRQKLMRQCEHDVNSRFGYVTFKLFKMLSTSGEIRETCEPMLRGVPYASLSKGEKFKAACDILVTLQTLYKVEMPLMIDDAESYTSNSLIFLPNQKFLFKVTDGDLKVEVRRD